MRKFKKGIVYLLFAIPVVTQLYPLLWLLLYSLKTNEEIMDGSFFSSLNRFNGITTAKPILQEVI